MTTIRLYADTDDAPPPGREWLARIERGNTATVVWGSSRAEARAKAERAVAEEARLAKARASAGPRSPRMAAPAATTEPSPEHA